ncbi:MAG: ubiquitin-like small modifier protein 1 [Nitrospinota bacterium]
MAINVRVPSPLQKLTNGNATVESEGATVQEVFNVLEEKFPGMKERLYDDNGTLRRFINIYVNEEDIRFLKGDETAVKDGDEISIIPAIAGGK